MTMPLLMNCPHRGDGWCLNCVRAELAEVRDQLDRAEHFVGCIIQAFHRAGLNDFNLRDIDANIAEIRRQAAQSCADTAVTARERWHARNDASAEVAAGCIAQDIRTEFALAEQPPISPPAQDAGERHGKGKPVEVRDATT
jgi:hypothetical protein